jgi:hypothetical protein
VRFLIRHPFGGRGGDWVEDVEDAQYLTVMAVLRIISGMVHRNIDQVGGGGILSMRIHLLLTLLCV